MLLLSCAGFTFIDSIDSRFLNFYVADLFGAILFISIIYIYFNHNDHLENWSGMMAIKLLIQIYLIYTKYVYHENIWSKKLLYGF